VYNSKEATGGRSLVAMSGLYYVIMKFYRESESHYVNRYPHLFCFESRYAADELFRALQNKKDLSGSHIFNFNRVSPQFWCYDYGAEGIISVLIQI
jgi:hypothetical protein